MDYNSQHFLPGPQFPEHLALTAAEIDAKRAENLNRAATQPGPGKEDRPLLPETPLTGGESRSRGAYREL